MMSDRYGRMLRIAEEAMCAAAFCGGNIETGTFGHSAGCQHPRSYA